MIITKNKPKTVFIYKILLAVLCIEASTGDHQNNVGIGGPTPTQLKNLCITFEKLKLSLGIPGDFQDPRGYQSHDAQVCYVKWCRPLHTVGPLRLWTPNIRAKTTSIY